MTPELGRILIVIALALAGLGLLLALGIKIPLGNLPGDIKITTEGGTTIYIPLASMLVISVILSVMASVFFRR